MINIHNLSLSFGAQAIFDHISLVINQQQHIGLVGCNGAGKSTLLKALAGTQIIDDGSITIIKNKKIAYLAQEVTLASHLNVLEETYSTFSQLHALEQEKNILEGKLSHHTTPELVERYAAVCEELSHENPDAARAETKRMLLGLGFRPEQLDASVSSLSTGWRMRIVLAKLLLQKADFYLFDEPTNHLDIVTKDWFLDFLKHASFGFLLVCHERYFLDQACNTIIELEHGKANVYQGNYTSYIKQKEQNLAVLQATAKQQEKEIAQKMDTIQRFRAKANKARMAQSMLKAVEKIERVVIPPSAHIMSVSFPPLPQPGRIVLKAISVAYSFGHKPLFEQVSCEIERGQRVALVAGNGVGKTTLFTLIANKRSLQKGTITWGHNVNYALFDQDQNAALEGNWSVFDTISYHSPQKNERDIRAMLGAFLFNSEESQKKIKVLSGGEKNRVGMVKTLLQDANVLILDEPTNHLDIPSKEVLVKALKNYPGTILFVSHDHDFINALATHILELTPTGVHRYEGNYQDYLYQKGLIEAQKSNETDSIAKKPSSPTKPEKSQKEIFESQKKIKSVEQKIEKLEREIGALEASFGKIAFGSPEFKQASVTLTQLKNTLAATMTEWESYIE